MGFYVLDNSQGTSAIRSIFLNCWLRFRPRQQSDIESETGFQNENSHVTWQSVEITFLLTFHLVFKRLYTEKLIKHLTVWILQLNVLNPKRNAEVRRGEPPDQTCWNTFGPNLFGLNAFERRKTGETQTNETLMDNPHIPLTWKISGTEFSCNREVSGKSAEKIECFLDIINWGNL